MFNDIKSVLALITLIFFFSCVVLLFFIGVPKDNLDLLKTVVLALISSVSFVVGYYFGSSDGSARKTELMLPPAGTATIAATSVQGLAPLKDDTGFIRIPMLLVLAALACLLMLAAGCGTTSTITTPTPDDSPQVIAGKSLLAVKSTIVSAGLATDGLCKAGKLDAATCAQAKTAYEKAKLFYDASVDGYLLMVQGGDPAAFAATLQRTRELAETLLTLSGGAQ